jgi:putative ATP-binding cassette transporter
MVFITVVAGLVSGACNAALIALINTTLHQTQVSTRTLVMIFVAIAVTKLSTSAVSQILMGRFAQKAMANLRQQLVRRVIQVSLRRLEELGTSRILANLTDDVLTISGALFAVPQMAVNLAVLAGGAAYLAYLSPRAFGVMAVLIALGVGGYRWVVTRAFTHVRTAREHQDSLFAHLTALTQGIKELKLHRPRREAFLRERLERTNLDLQHFSNRATARFVWAHSLSQVFLYGAIGWILFVLPRLDNTPPEALTGYLIAFVYLMGPLGGVLNTVQGFSRANIAMGKIEQLGVALDVDEPTPGPATETGPERPWASLALVGVTHAYHREQEDRHFKLGPIDLRFRPGELVFILGGNGSGKSTLAKVLCGLYPPESGAIYLDDRAIGDADRDAYRQHFSVVFSDFCLFDSLLGLNRANLDAQATRYLEQLHLDRKVRVQDGVFSTTHLSQGQRKRLALLTAYLEDRPFYVFDEWASDQDPLFKEIFYLRLLPELKARGKTVLVITHDDRYMHVADRCLRMEEGLLQAS